MRTRLILMSFVMAVVIISPAYGGAPELLVSHSYGGYTTDGNTYAMAFDLTVSNPTNSHYYNLVIDTDLASLLVSEPTPLTVGTMAPGDKTTVTVTLVTRHLPGGRELNEMPLFWRAEASDDAGQHIVILVPSHSMIEGGAP